MDHPPERIRVVRCPTCSGESVYGSGNSARPFCSERCKNMDFGSWSSEGFRLPTQATPDNLLTEQIAIH